MYERFTDRSRRVFQLANQEAHRFNHEYIGTEHILLGLIKEGHGVAAHVLKNLDMDLRKVRLEVEKRVQSGRDSVETDKLPQTPRAKKVIELSMEAARELNHNYVGTEHLLIGLLREKEGIAFQVLDSLGVTESAFEDVRILLGVNEPLIERCLRHYGIIEKQDTNERYKAALSEVVRVLSVYIGDCDAKNALESISAIVNDTLAGEDPS